MRERAFERRGGHGRLSRVPVKPDGGTGKLEGLKLQSCPPQAAMFISPARHSALRKRDARVPPRCTRTPSGLLCGTNVVREKNCPNVDGRQARGAMRTNEKMADGKTINRNVFFALPGIRTAMTVAPRRRRGAWENSARRRTPSQATPQRDDEASHPRGRMLPGHDP